MPLFWWPAAAIHLALLARLRITGMVRVLPWFSSYLVCRLVQATIPFFAANGTRQYAWAWLATEAGSVALLIPTVWELYRRNTERLYGLGTIGVTVLAVSAVLATATTGWTAWEWPGYGGMLANLVLFKRLAYTWLLVCTLALIGFYWRFPLALDKSIRAHVRIVFAYLGSHAGIYWVQSARPAWVELGNEYLTFAWFGCLAAWNWFIRAPSLAPEANPAELAEAERQAAALEDLLRRA